VASRAGIGWELLAACDWMQCQARQRYSPVNGEKLGTINPDGTVFRTRSAALAQCASDLIELADAVYLIDLPGRKVLSVLELANVFAAFRWGGLLEAHGISAIEFPYSVAGLTAQHLKMRWPDIDHPYAPDKPGARFRLPFGAVPVVLSLGYRATALVRRIRWPIWRRTLHAGSALFQAGPNRSRHQRHTLFVVHNFDKVRHTVCLSRKMSAAAARMASGNHPCMTEGQRAASSNQHRHTPPEGGQDEPGSGVF